MEGPSIRPSGSGPSAGPSRIQGRYRGCRTPPRGRSVGVRCPFATICGCSAERNHRRRYDAIRPLNPTDTARGRNSDSSNARARGMCALYAVENHRSCGPPGRPTAEGEGGGLWGGAEGATCGGSFGARPPTLSRRGGVRAATATRAGTAWKSPACPPRRPARRYNMPTRSRPAPYPGWPKPDGPGPCHQGRSTRRWRDRPMAVARPSSVRGQCRVPGWFPTTYSARQYRQVRS
jgi:hypothetical protein